MSYGRGTNITELRTAVASSMATPRHELRPPLSAGPTTRASIDIRYNTPPHSPPAPAPYTPSPLGYQSERTSGSSEPVNGSATASGPFPTSTEEPLSDMRNLNLSYLSTGERGTEYTPPSSMLAPSHYTPSPVTRRSSTLMSPLAMLGTLSLSHRVADARDGKATSSSATDSDSKLVAPLMICTDFDDFHWETFEALPTSPLQETHQPELPPPQAVELARTGKGYIGIITTEKDILSQVQPQTTHLTFKQCPISNFSCLATPHFLVVLDLAGCNLHALPRELAHCCALEELNISNNPLGDSATDTAFAPLLQVQHLRMLLADNCGLTKIPMEIMSLAYLHILGLRRNQLTHMPTWLSRLDYLQVLLIEGNMNMTAPWRSVLTPLLDMEHAREREPMESTQQAPGKSGAGGEPRRPSSSPGLFRWLRSGTVRVSSNPERPSRWFRNKESTTPTESVRNSAKPSPPSATLRSLMVPVSTPSQTTLFPMPALGKKNEELPFPSFFLPIYDKDEADASIRWLKKYGVLHVRRLLEYLRDMDDLRPEQHRETVPVSMPMGSSALGSPGITYSAISSVAGSDSTPLDTPGEVALRGGILEEAGANVFASPSTGTSTPGGSVGVKENPVKRSLVLNEVIETERTYVAGLSELMDIYVQGARQPLDAGTDERVLSVPMERRIFGHVEGIVHFHRDAFLPSLEQATNRLRTMTDPNSESYATTTAHIAADVANVFSEHAAYFKMYMNYVNQYETAVFSIAKWSDPSATRSRPAMKTTGSSLTNRAQRLLHSDSPVDERGSDDMILSASEQRRFQSYLRQCRCDPRHSQISLEGYLLLPIQRIPRYRMMLEQLIKCTSCDMLPDTDRESLTRAFAHISLVASWVNEGKRQSEQGRRLLQWQSKLRGNFSAPLVQPHRRLVCDGPLRLCRVNKRLGRAPNLFSDDDVLEQSNMDLPVHLLLCNDLAVVVSGLAAGESPATPVSPLNPSDPDPVDLIAVLKPQIRMVQQQDKNLLLPPASVGGDVYLRVVDARYVFYFCAQSPRDAMRWRTAINAQPF